MARTALISAAAAVAVAATIQAGVGAPPAATAAPGGPGAPDLADALVVGQVTQATTGAAAPVAVAGATVTVWWIPGIESAQPGDELPIEALATDRTAADGSYAIDIVPTPAMKSAAERNGGWLNFDVGVADTTSGKLATAGVTRRLTSAGWQDTAPQDQPALLARTTGERVPVATGPVDLALTPSSPDISPANAAPAARGTAAARGSSAATLAEAPAPGSAYCSFIVDGRPQRWVNVVEFHNASKSEASWSYGRTADSNIESGIDYSGDGGWKVGVTRHISNQTSAKVFRSYPAGKAVNHFASTKFEFVDGHYQPYGAGSTCRDTTIPVNTKVKNPVTWYGGVSANTGAGSEFIGCANAPQSNHRAGYGIGSGFTRDENKAAKIGAAVDLGPIKVGAQSGFSSNVSVKWTAKERRGIWLCGTYSAPPTAGVIHAQNRPMT
ncbi:hypothetical protein ABFU82_06205 [Nocardioides sp. WV_118_6]